MNTGSSSIEYSIDSSIDFFLLTTKSMIMALIPRSTKDMFMNSNLVYYSLSLFNIFSDLLMTILGQVSRFINSIYNEYSFYGHYWIFMKDEYLPLSYFKFKRIPSDIDYFYDESQKVLMEKGCNARQEMLFEYQTDFSLPWLMASIIHIKDNNSSLNNRRYYLEDIYNLRVIANIDNKDTFTIPLPETVLACWSIHSGIWFNQNDKIQMEIMTKTGEMYLINDVFKTNSEPNEFEKWWSALGFDKEDTQEDTQGDKSAIELPPSPPDEVLI